MALRAVFFDVGETLVDEERWWRQLAERDRPRPHVVWAALGVTIARGEDHTALWAISGSSDPTMWDGADVRARRPLSGCDRVPRAAPADGFRVGIVGNQTARSSAGPGSHELSRRLISSSASWGVRKPDLPSSPDRERRQGVPPGEVAYVGDRVDNDVIPAAAAGLVAVHLRRGPWGRLQDASGHAALRSRPRGCLMR